MVLISLTLYAVLFSCSLAQVPPVTPQPPHKFADKQEIHDQEHIKTHLDGQVDPNRQMTNEQLQFHYFKMHDSNNDNMLDGVELIKAITHWHGDEKTGQPATNATPTPTPKLSDNELEDMIDGILRDDDYNRDGFIDYSEFVRSQNSRR